jgi:diguanylate cyclase (GGDEF)-like protein/PAS domain S-box-containing protein
MRAPLPLNESLRLHVLRRCQILDTPPESEFDDIVHLAAQMCRAPLAWLALIDEKRVFLKARHQFMLRELPRDGWPCAQAILEEDLLLVRDLEVDPRFSPIQNADQKVRFYSGAPLVTHDGYALGVLAILDYAPRGLSDEEKEALRALARQTTLQLEWRRHAFANVLPARPLPEEIDDEAEAALAPPSPEERFRNAFEHAVIGMALLDLDGQFLTVNPSLCGIAGYTAQELLTTNFQAITHPDDLEFDLEQMRQMLEGEILSYEIERRLTLRRGNEAWVLLSISLVRDDGGQPLYFLAQLQDITKRKHAEERLQDAHEELKVRVGELERHTREMTLIGEMGEFLQSCRSVDEAYKIMARTIKQLFPATNGALFAFDAAKDNLEAVVNWGEVRTETYFTPDECWGLRRNRMHLVECNGSELACSHVVAEATSSDNCQDYLCLPLIAQRETLGLLHLMTDENQPLGEDRQQLARTVGEQVSLALANLHLQERLRNQSIRDPLTGLFNRRYLEESLEREINRAARSKKPLGLIMLDIDFFKKFNDTHGHDAGDAVLRQVAEMLSSYLRKADSACRYGGEEFTLILPEADLQSACQKAEQLREAARRLEIQYGRAIVGPISLSLGVSCFPQHGTTSEELLHAADTALYQSKTGGRDRVTAAEGINEHEKLHQRLD